MARNKARMAGVLFVALASIGAYEVQASHCPHSLKQRGAAEVLASHRAALAAQDWQAVACNYADDIVVVHDQGTTVGRDAVVQDLKNITGLFGASFPQVHEERVVAFGRPEQEMVRVLWSIVTPCVEIMDGADTYIVGSGKIQAQTAHGFPAFRC